MCSTKKVICSSDHKTAKIFVKGVDFMQGYIFSKEHCFVEKDIFVEYLPAAVFVNIALR